MERGCLSLFKKPGVASWCCDGIIHQYSSVCLLWLCTQYSKHWGSRLCNIEKEFCSEKDPEWRYLRKKCDELAGRMGTAVTDDPHGASAGKRMREQVENRPWALELWRPLLQ